MPNIVESRQVKHHKEDWKARKNTPAGHTHHEEF